MLQYATAAEITAGTSKNTIVSPFSLAQSKPATYIALLTQETTSATVSGGGFLVAVHVYKIVTLEAGDNFSNLLVVEGGTFTYVATAPTTWTNGSLVVDITLSKPIATILENTLGAVPVWSYNAEGIYELTLEGAFAGNVTIKVGNETSVELTPICSVSDDVITLTVSEAATPGTGVDDVLLNTSIEIKVYA